MRQDRIGDVLVSTPLFQVLKQRYPNAIIDVLLSSNNHFALANDPLVRKRLIYRKNLFSALRVLKAIWDERYDFVIDLMDNPSATSTVICLLSKSRWNVGLEKENSFAYDIVVPLLSRKETHIVDRIAQLLVPFGIDPCRADLRIRYTVGKQAVQFAQRVFEDHRIQPGTAIGINISAGDDVRFWGVDNFRALVSLLQQKYNDIPILLLFKPTHRRIAEEIGRGFRQVYLPPTTHSFDEFAALIRDLGFLITPDTSAVHLAAAFSIPAVVMYVQSNKNLRIWDPYKTPNEVLVADIDDLRAISPEAVFRAAQKLIDDQAPKTHRKFSAAIQ